MPIKKQEFYEGAALHQLARAGAVTELRYADPFFLVNGSVFVLLKYSTKGRSPWGFTFASAEQRTLANRASRSSVVIALVCGGDGVAAFSYDSFRTIAPLRDSSLHIASYRPHGKHYQISGPEGILDEKVAPSNWRLLLHR